MQRPSGFGDTDTRIVAGGQRYRVCNPTTQCSFDHKKADGSLSQLPASLELEPVHPRAPVEEAPQLFIVLSLEDDPPLIQKQVRERAGVQEAPNEGECQDSHCEDAVGRHPGGQAGHAEGSFH